MSRSGSARFGQCQSGKRCRMRIRGRSLCAAVAAMLGAAGLAPSATAQCFNYNITTGTDGTIVPGTTDIGNHVDDGYTNITFPFSVTFYGGTYNSANIGSNGLIGFTSTALGFGNTCPLVA